MRAALNLAVALATIAPSLAWGWTSTFGREQGAPAQGRVAVDVAGNVVTATQSKERLTVLRHETATARRAWSVTLEDDARPSGVAVDTAGDALVAGFYPTNPFPSSADQIVVAKLDDARGTLLWRVDFAGFDPSEIVVDGAGAAVLAWENGPFGVNAARFDAATGATQWTRGWLDVQDPAVAIDPADDVLVAGAIGTSSGVRATKVAQADGSTLWDVTVATSPAPTDVAVTSDPSGNAIVVDGGTVLKLAAASGAELWRNDTIAAGQLRRPVAAANGDVVVLAGATDVVRLDGATGGVRWSRSATEFGLSSTGPNAIVDANDDVLVLFGDLAIRRLAALDADTGATLWVQPILGGAVVTPTDLALGAAGLVGAGWTSSGSPLASSLVLGVGARLAGTKLALKDVGGDPAKSTFEVQSKDPRLTPPYPTGDPQDPTVGGATVTILNPTTLETGVIALPASGWSARAPAGKLGRESYKYKDPSCTATVQSGKRLLVKCKGTLGGFTLDEASQGSLAVTIAFGAGGHPYCTAFGGQILQDVGTGGTGTGSFLAREAPAPTTCPGAF